MPRKAHEWRRVCTVPADFRVSEAGKVKLVDPPNHRLRYFEVCGHLAFTLLGRAYFVADLVARAYLGSHKGLIDFADGDTHNVRPDNLLITAEETATTLALMRPDPLPKTRVTTFH
jgi:hypothetical protein